jgi:transposase-like protein
VHTIAKITPDDYSDLLAAVDEGVSQRALARRYGCAPSLIARHVAKAKRPRELRDLEQVPQADLSIGPIEGSTREILEARIRDPKTPARDLANLANALARLIKDEAPAPPDSPAFLFRPGTLILEPGRRSRGAERRFRLMLRAPGRVEHLSSRDYDLTAADALYLVICCLASELGLTPEALGLSPEDIAGAAGSKQPATG